MATKTRGESLAWLQAMLGMQLDEVRARAICKACEDIPEEDFWLLCGQAFRYEKFIPTPARFHELWKGSDDDRAIVGWGHVVAEIHRVGHTREPDFDGATWAGVKAAGGWSRVLDIGEDDAKRWEVRKAFMAGYGKMAEYAPRPKGLPGTCALNTELKALPGSMGGYASGADLVAMMDAACPDILAAALEVQERERIQRIADDELIEEMQKKGGKRMTRTEKLANGEIERLEALRKGLHSTAWSK